MNLLPDNIFPPSIHGLLRTISRAGFFDRSVMIGSWVMLVYQELYGVRYACGQWISILPSTLPTNKTNSGQT